MKDIYTSGVLITMFGTVYYCFNDKYTSIYDFLNIEKNAFIKAIDNKWKLFYVDVIKHENSCDIGITLSLN